MQLSYLKKVIVVPEDTIDTSYTSENPTLSKIITESKSNSYTHIYLVEDTKNIIYNGVIYGGNTTDIADKAYYLESLDNDNDTKVPTIATVSYMVDNRVTDSRNYDTIQNDVDDYTIPTIRTTYIIAENVAKNKIPEIINDDNIIEIRKEGNKGKTPTVLTVNTIVDNKINDRILNIPVSNEYDRENTKYTYNSPSIFMTYSMITEYCPSINITNSSYFTQHNNVTDDDSVPTVKTTYQMINSNILDADKYSKLKYNYDYTKNRNENNYIPTVATTTYIMDTKIVPASLIMTKKENNELDDELVPSASAVNTMFNELLPRIIDLTYYLSYTDPVTNDDKSALTAAAVSIMINSKIAHDFYDLSYTAKTDEYVPTISLVNKIIDSKFKVCTQEEYDALPDKNDDVFYYITL